MVRMPPATAISTRNLTVDAIGNHSEKRSCELDVTAAHHPRVESAGQQQEYDFRRRRHALAMPGHGASEIDIQ